MSNKEEGGVDIYSSIGITYFDEDGEELEVDEQNYHAFHIYDSFCDEEITEYTNELNSDIYSREDKDAICNFVIESIKNYIRNNEEPGTLKLNNGQTVALEFDFPFMDVYQTWLEREREQKKQQITM